MTGAPLPEGTDCVINFECVTQSEDMLFVSQPLHPWQNVDQQGDEIRFGTPLLKKGDRLTPFHLGLLASQGYGRIPVFKKPRAAILSTGSELVSPGLALSPGKIYDSNLYVFRALLEQEGCHVTQCCHVADEEDTIHTKLHELASRHDLIVTTGGASVGDKDYISRVLEQAGATILFSHIRMKPGSCCYGAKLGSCIVISLSGNPGAALTSWFLIALPVVRKLAGRQNFHLQEMVLPPGGYSL
jgi:molybdopterin molybdotransferase